MTTIRAHFDGKVLIPVEPVDLPKDKLLEVDIRETEELPLGSPARFLKAIQGPPHLTREDVDELERAIEQGKLPVRNEGIFDDPAGEEE